MENVDIDYAEELADEILENIKEGRLNEENNKERH